MTPVWQLKFIDRAGTGLVICGSEEVMRAGRDETVEALESTNGLGKKVIHVEGFTDSADRGEASLDVCTEAITAVFLFRIY